jgi:hypothetical protein
MSIVVTVLITGTTVEKVRQVEKVHPELKQKMIDLTKKHGLIAHRELHNGDEILHVDEWKTKEGFEAFLKEARPTIDELARLRGANIPTDKVWKNT